jgi:hypothetical protein
VLTTFIVNDGSSCFLRICRVDVVPLDCGVAARSPPLPEATTIDMSRREEQRASGLAKVVKSNLGKPGLSKHRARIAAPRTPVARSERSTPVYCWSGLACSRGLAA